MNQSHCNYQYIETDESREPHVVYTTMQVWLSRNRSAGINVWRQLLRWPGYWQVERRVAVHFRSLHACNAWLMRRKRGDLWEPAGTSLVLIPSSANYLAISSNAFSKITLRCGVYSFNPVLLQANLGSYFSNKMIVLYFF